MHWALGIGYALGQRIYLFYCYALCKKHLATPKQKKPGEGGRKPVRHGACWPAGANQPQFSRCPLAAVQEDLRRADERQERAARNLVPPFTFGAPGAGGGHRHARRGRPSAREFLLSRAAVA
jgi:hypothetical protein